MSANQLEIKNIKTKNADECMYCNMSLLLCQI